MGRIAPRPPGDERTLKVLRVVARRTRALKLPCLLVGAAARGFTLGRLGLPRVERATLDVDVAVQVSGWQEFKDLRQALIADDRFESEGLPHRVLSPDGVALDLLPFGGVEEGGKITWGDHDGLAMDVALFDDVLTAGSKQLIDDGLFVTVPSLECLIAMELVAWRDRHLDHAQDVMDLSELLKRARAMHSDAWLYDNAPSLMDEFGYDAHRVCLCLLGAEMRQQVSPFNRQEIERILSDALDEDGALDLVRGLTKAGLSSPHQRLVSVLDGIRRQAT